MSESRRSSIDSAASIRSALDTVWRPRRGRRTRTRWTVRTSTSRSRARERWRISQEGRSRNGEKMYWEDLEEREKGVLESGVNVETTLPLVPLTGDKASRCTGETPTARTAQR